MAFLDTSVGVAQYGRAAGDGGRRIIACGARNSPGLSFDKVAKVTFGDAIVSITRSSRLRTGHPQDGDGEQVARSWAMAGSKRRSRGTDIKDRQRPKAPDHPFSIAGPTNIGAQ